MCELRPEDALYGDDSDRQHDISYIAHPPKTRFPGHLRSTVKPDDSAGGVVENSKESVGLHPPCFAERRNPSQLHIAAHQFVPSLSSIHKHDRIVECPFLQLSNHVVLFLYSVSRLVCCLCPQTPLEKNMVPVIPHHTIIGGSSTILHAHC